MFDYRKIRKNITFDTGCFKGKKADVLGFGVSNVPLVGFLLDKGAEVTVRDKKDFSLLGKAALDCSERGARFVCGDDYLSGIDGDFVFRSPGIRFDHPEIARAVKNGAVLSSEMELFFELCPGRIVGVTGSDGKTTTTTLIHLCLSDYFGKDRVFVGGNIGEPLLPKLGMMDSESWAVVELSSFQLQTMKKSPDISIITNIAPNHLDYHTGMDEYIESKTNIFRHQDYGRVVLNTKNEITRGLASLVPKGSETLGFAGSGTVESEGVIVREGTPFFRADEILIPGRHNVENFEGVIAAIGDIVPCGVIEKTARTFKGVPHRIELVRELRDVRFYNSSIDSSPTRTAAALRSFTHGEKITVICGGYDKHIPFGPLADVLCEKADKVVLTGATADKILSALTEKEERPEIYVEPDFEKAVRRAAGLAYPGGVVILSPACASFDSFRNFEERGNRFRDIVNSLE
ncbi:MAG: UDP-N-acetylmuramoyl-L-alanine--D-glutamate ligase [Clostridia bacterium]|nr:UDP-N-acetylmuramoyl-L-alanine--D-glutamate ligase [Clostridia bacterium]